MKVPKWFGWLLLGIALVGISIAGLLAGAWDALDNIYAWMQRHNI